MTHFKKYTSPHIIMISAYVYVCIIGLCLYFQGLYDDNKFFRWGTPVVFFSVKIESQRTFYLLQAMIFFHQIINNCVNSVVYPWIINEIQDPKNIDMTYPRGKSLLLINLFNIYSEIDVVLIITGFMSQISFVVIIILANILTSTMINYRYISLKMDTKTNNNSLQTYNTFENFNELDNV